MAFMQTDVNYATQYARELANVYPYLSYFSDLWAAQNSNRYRPVQGKTVAIPSMTVSGARAVDRDHITGAFNRNWNNEWQMMTMGMDREWDTIIDPMDISETGDVATIANVTRTFNEQQKVPEMDAYAASRLAGFANGAGGIDTTPLTAENILAQWDEYLAYMTNNRVNRDRIRAKITPAAYKLLKEAAGITRFIDTGTGIRNVDRNVGKLDGVQIEEVPSDIMQTAFDFTEGWIADGGAKINLLMYDPEAIVAPVVYDVAMMGAPTAQSKGKYVYYERYYYDVFALNTRSAGIFANVSAASALKTLAVTSVADATAGTDITVLGGTGNATSVYLYAAGAGAKTVTAGTKLNASDWKKLEGTKGVNVTGLTNGNIITVVEANRDTLMPIASGTATVVNK